jgi:hypothetical protein
MPKVIIESELNIKDQSFFNKAFAKNKSYFRVSKSLIKFINDIENRGDRQIIYYVIYKIISEIRLDPVSINPTPKNGLLFTDYDNKPNSLEIFHCHLNGDMVLIWYVTKESNGDLNLEIKYIQHPLKYDSILKYIYKNTDGYNTVTGDYFKNYRSSTYLKDSFIQKWFYFINNF